MFSPLDYSAILILPTVKPCCLMRQRSSLLSLFIDFNISNNFARTAASTIFLEKTYWTFFYPERAF